VRIWSSDGETKVTVLAGVSELVTSIDVPRAQAAKEAAEAELSVATRDDQADETRTRWRVMRWRGPNFVWLPRSKS